MRRVAAELKARSVKVYGDPQDEEITLQIGLDGSAYEVAEQIARMPKEDALRLTFLVKDTHGCEAADADAAMFKMNSAGRWVQYREGQVVGVGAICCPYCGEAFPVIEGWIAKKEEDK